MDLPNSVTHFRHGEKEIYLIGTAHVSQRSIDEVRELIQQLRPDTVCVELDEARYRAMLDPDRWRRLDIFQVVRQKKVLFTLSTLALSAYQRRIAEELGVEPGGELKEAVTQAEAVGAQLVLADRDIQATLKRTWHNLSWWNRTQVLSSLVASMFAAEKISAADVEKLKERDTLSEAMKAFAQSFPQIQIPLIDERDRYLMSMIEEAPGKTIVAVVGAGHVEGMLSYRGKQIDREALSRIPKPSGWSKLLPWLIPMLVLAAFYYGYQKHAGDNLEEMLYAWIIPNSVAAALLTLVAGGKLLTIIAAFIGSPITSLNPMIGAGMVAGLVEAWLRKPTVEDCEGVPKAVQSVRGMYRNPFTRVLLVAFAATLGSALGAWIGASWLVALVSS